MASYLIDITRFISRIGRGHPTGIDRVEIEYIRALSKQDADCLCFAKLGREFCVLRAEVVANSMETALSGDTLRRPRLRDAVRFKLPKQQRAARSFYRAAAVSLGQTPKSALNGIDLRGVEYVNVGHSDLSATVFQAIHAAGARISVMVHDMIPLDHPEYTRDGISAAFERKMRAVAGHADRVICNSAFTKGRVLSHFAKWHKKPEIVVAHLGIEPLEGARHTPAEHPHFVILGTIEPRKNHQLLFDAWDRMAARLPEADMPHLHVIGNRGWKNEQVFAFLDQSPLMGRCIHEHGNLGDDALARHISTSRGLLFPSHAEGFGLPALEAAQMGVPVYCSDLEVFHEIMGDYATYLNQTASAVWADTLQSVAKMPPNQDAGAKMVNKALKIPRWHSHFRHVFGNTGDRQDFDE